VLVSSHSPPANLWSNLRTITYKLHTFTNTYMQIHGISCHVWQRLHHNALKYMLASVIAFESYCWSKCLQAGGGPGETISVELSFREFVELRRQVAVAGICRTADIRKIQKQIVIACTCSQEFHLFRWSKMFIQCDSIFRSHSNHFSWPLANWLPDFIHFHVIS
jgi:hypothetical protein